MYSKLLSYISTIFLFSIIIIFNSTPATAACVTSGVITISCNLLGNTTGSITLGQINSGITMTLASSLTIGNTINDDDVNADGIISTNGTGITINQTSIIGGTSNIATLNLGLGDIWNSSASMFITNFNINAGTMNINNGGDLFGVVDDLGGIGTLNYGANLAGGSFKIRGGIDTVAITLTSGTLFTNGNNIGVTTALGDITINNGTTFNADDNIISNGILTNNGTIRIAATRTLSVGNQANSSGKFIFEVDTTSKFAKLLVPTLNDVDIRNATIEISVKRGDIQNNDELLIGEGIASVNNGLGQTALSVADNSYIWDFKIADGSQSIVNTVGATNNKIYLIITETNPIITAATSANNANVGKVIDTISGTLSGQLQVLVTNMNQANSKIALNNFLESSQPTIDGSEIKGVLNFTKATSSLMTKRLAQVSSNSYNRSGFSAGPPDDINIADGWKAWAEILAQNSLQENRGGIDGYRSAAKGVTLGVDTKNYVDNMILGASFSFGTTDSVSRNVNRTNTTITNNQFSFYGSYLPDNNNYYNGIISIATNEAETIRYDVGGVAGLTAKGDADGIQYSINIEAGKNYMFPNNMTVSPYVKSNLSSYYESQYTETGAGGASLAIKSTHVNAVEIGAGINIKWLLTNKRGKFFEPKIRAGYMYDIMGDVLQKASSFTGDGANFITNSFTPANSTMDIGISVKYYQSYNWKIGTNYDYQFKSDYSSHTGSIIAYYNF